MDCSIHSLLADARSPSRTISSTPDLRTFVVLNKVDTVEPACAKDLSAIYSSEKVAMLCAEASAACGVPTNNVFPMKSYSGEYKTDFRVSRATASFSHMHCRRTRSRPLSAPQG